MRSKKAFYVLRLLCLAPFFATSTVSIVAAEEEHLMQREIEHVVVLMLENRSFDNVLAWLYNDNQPPSHFIPYQTEQRYHGLSEDTLEQYTNVLENSSGQIVFSSPPIKGIPSVAGTPYLNSPKFDPFESFEHILKQVFGKGTNPSMKGFLQDYATHWWEHEWASQKKEISAVMETYTEKELPITYGLARQYAVSDLWFASVPTQTNPNRAFSICGTSEGQVNNGPLGKSVFNSDTIWNRLSEESPESDWAIFWQADMIPGIIPGSYCKNSYAALNRIPNCDDHFLTMDRFHELARNGQLPAYSFIEPQWTLSIDFDPKVKVLIEALLLGVQGNDFHPPGDVRTAENLIANIYTSLCANQEAWNKTLLIITFDEHGGLFDHVPPPMAIAPDNLDEQGFNFDRYGVRVPTIFISPRIKKGTVVRSENAEIPFDHTSLISTLLKWKKVDQSKWNMGKRVQIAPTFDSVITEEIPREDHIIGSSSLLNSYANEEDVIAMGESFYLRDKKGNYIVKSDSSIFTDAHVGSAKNRALLQLTGGNGNVTHGSFVLIQTCDPSRKDGNLLETSLTRCDCFYGPNRHTPGQWWTIKSVDQPFLGSKIRYGDKVYIENHIYLDPFQQVPARLTQREGLLSKYLVTKTVTSEGSEDNYWIIEKP